MIPIEALELAVRKEEEALEFYNKLALDHPSMKDVFIFLVNEEAKHKKLLDDKIAELRK